MKKMQFITTVFLMSATLCAAPSHHGKSGKKNHEEASYQNVVVPASQDEQLFLLPHLQNEKSDLVGQSILDIGCGTGAWALSLAKRGAQVCAFDSHKDSLEKAQLAVALAGIGQRISLMEGNPLDLPYEDARFDGVVSMQLGQQISPTEHVISSSGFSVTGLDQHMQEIARVLKSGGEVTVVAPACYDVVFTDGTCSQEAAMEHVHQVLAQLQGSSDSEHIKEGLGALKEINRATFMMRDQQLHLVTKLSDLKSGEMIWRKEAQMVESGVYHTEEEYLVALHNAGLKCIEVKRPCFFGRVKYNFYQQEHQGEVGLGASYIDNNPFTVFIAVKNSALPVTRG